MAAINEHPCPGRSAARSAALLSRGPFRTGQDGSQLSVAPFHAAPRPGQRAGFSRLLAAGIIVRRGFGGFMLQLQSAFGVLALLAIAWALSENRRAVSLRQAAVGLAVTVVTALVLLKLPPVAKAFGAINDAVNTISAASRAGTSFVFGYIGGGALAIRPQDAGRGFHPGVPGAADHPGHERADDAAVLLARPAAGRARHGVAAGAHARRRRRGRPVDRGQHLPRHGRGAAVHPPLSRAAHRAASCSW